MATGRLINTNFWKDIYISNLDPIEKLLFLYLFTNPQTSLAGVYQLNVREVAFDTGIDKDMVAKVLKRFCDDGKMHYEKDWLVLRNFIKHQRPNPSIKLGIKKAIDDLPKWLQTRLNELDFGTQTSLNMTDSPQSGDSLGTPSPQRKLKEAKLIEAKEKEKKRKLMPAAPEHLKNIDFELAAKERAARTRKATTAGAEKIDIDKLFPGTK